MKQRYGVFNISVCKRHSWKNAHVHQNAPAQPSKQSPFEAVWPKSVSSQHCLGGKREVRFAGWESTHDSWHFKNFAAQPGFSGAVGLRPAWRLHEVSNGQSHQEFQSPWSVARAVLCLAFHSTKFGSTVLFRFLSICRLQLHCLAVVPCVWCHHWAWRPTLQILYSAWWRLLGVQIHLILVQVLLVCPSLCRRQRHCPTHCQKPDGDGRSSPAGR